jgi:Mrp family chromosome partitioning ATPase
MEIEARQKSQLVAENEKISKNLQNIRHRIVVFSGKGGVGKTTVSVNLALGLKMMDQNTGLLDADVTGPNVPKMLGLTAEPVVAGGRIYPRTHLKIKVISLATLIAGDQPIIWRGPMRSKLLNQFLGDVDWGKLDYLIADLPPGTGDEILTMTQKMEPDFAVIVTTPQELSLIDASKAVNMAKKMKIPHIGIVENMSGLICPKCGHLIELFGRGGGKQQARDMDVPFLGSIPMNIETISLADQGKPIIIEQPDADISVAFIDIIGNIRHLLNS